MRRLSGLPIKKEDNLSIREMQILECILECWPTSAVEIAEHLGIIAKTRDERRRVSSKFSYYLKKLNEKKLIFSKRIGNALIVWPAEVEKYRTIHEILASEVDKNA
ncbi:MAG: hypothetical protein N3D73_00685 [Candidatus Diapherotrites archaeon]|nr:hypothetical protein [Candidatus Diapherotrites archaeon]